MVLSSNFIINVQMSTLQGFFLANDQRNKMILKKKQLVAKRLDCHDQYRNIKHAKAPTRADVP